MANNIRSMLNSDWAARRGKDPGKRSKRPKASGEEKKVEGKREKLEDWESREVVMATSRRRRGANTTREVEGKEAEEEDPPRLGEVNDRRDDCWDEKEGQELEDNLTYHEDSLSVFKGTVDTPAGKDLPVWVTTDSGSMTKLIQDDYARVMRFPRRHIPDAQTFNISSPGGGSDQIEEYVVLLVKVWCKKELVAEQGYDECGSEEGYQVIKMRFGVCASLPVPILWGGHEMRSHEVLDYHRVKTLSFKLGSDGGQRYITRTTSWMGATLEMREEARGKVRKACKYFMPSLGRLANMVMGGRSTYNLAAILYPGRDNLVRVARHNARVDEGYNEVLVTNLEEFRVTYGDWVVPIECITNGEAYVIMRNNADRPIRINPGALKLMVRPTVTLPQVLAPREVLGHASEQGEEVRDEGNSSEKTQGGNQETDDGLEGTSSPRRLLTWNCNGLSSRVRKSDLKGRFAKLLEEKQPDIICLQEVQLECEPGEPGKVKRGSPSETVWKKFMTPLEQRFTPYLTLADSKYGGQAILVKKSIEEPDVSFNMNGEKGHYKAGRFVRLDFRDLVIRSVYAPFNGAGKEGHYDRRRKWDEELQRELRDGESSPGKARVLLGDLNVVLADEDISMPIEFWRKQGRQDVPEGDRGFGGTTINERKRAIEGIISGGGLVDTYIRTTGADPRGGYTFRGQGKFKGKGMKLDYILVDEALSLAGGIEGSEILCEVDSREGFMGSDHAPVMCVLGERWQRRRASLLAHYGAVDQGEARQRLKCMFIDSKARQSGKEEPPRTGEEVTINSRRHQVERPKLFPEEYWDFVEPDQKPLVGARFGKYTDTDYIVKCLTELETKLDVQARLLLSTVATGRG